MYGELMFDGGSHQSTRLAVKPNATCAFILRAEGEETSSFFALPSWVTNNQAEATALALGLECAAKRGCKELFVQGDSVFVINTMKGLYHLKNAGLKPIFAAAKASAVGMSVLYLFVPREFNTKADALCHKARLLPNSEIFIPQFLDK